MGPRVYWLVSAALMAAPACGIDNAPAGMPVDGPTSGDGPAADAGLDAVPDGAIDATPDAPMPICVPGATSCDGRQLKHCASDGLSFDTTTTCALSCNATALACTSASNVPVDRQQLCTTGPIVNAGGTTNPRFTPTPGGVDITCTGSCNTADAAGPTSVTVPSP